jgi:hypothetical protein
MRRPVSDHLPDCTELWSIDDYLHHARPDDPEKCDYCKAFRAAEQRVRDTTLHIDPIGYAAKHYEQGQRDERERIVSIVEEERTRYIPLSHRSRVLGDVLRRIKGDSDE